MRHADIAIPAGALTNSAARRADTQPIAASNFVTIQALRAVAALLVVIYHVFDMWSLRVNPTAPGVTWVNGAAGVDIFFVISGFVMVVSTRRMATQPGAWRTFIEHRIVRIVPLYWLATTAKLAFVILLADLTLRSTINFDYIIRSYLLFPVVDSAGHFRPLLSVGWTLTYEFLFYLLFALALALRVDVLRVLLPGLGLFVLAALFRKEGWPAWTILFNTIVIEFIFGVVLARLVLRGWLLPTAVAVGLVVVGFALVLVLPEGPEDFRPLTWGLPALAIVAGAVALERRAATMLPRWLLELGDASYSIYLTHGFVVPVIGLGFLYLGWIGLPAEAMAVLVGLFASAIVGTVVYRVVERPITLALKRPAKARP